MNYFPFHIGDYDSHTAHLSWLEDAAYSRMIRLYYRTEKPLSSKVEQICRLLRANSAAEKQAVKQVLEEFFILQDDGWHNSRCDAELHRANAKAERNRAVGKLGGRPKKSETKEVNSGNPQKTQTVISGIPNETLPIANSQEPKTTSVPSGTGDKPPKITDPQEIIFGYGVPLLTAASIPEKQARSFLGGLRKNHGDAKVVNALRDCLIAKPLQPLEWLAAVLPPAGNVVPLNRQESLEASNRAVALEAARMI